jgi:superfamily II DNA or RNA helicase
MAPGRRAIVFTEDIQHAKNLAEEFNRQGITAAAIWGTDKDRLAKQLAHQTGQIDVLCNCDVLTEGYETGWFAPLRVGATVHQTEQ